MKKIVLVFAAVLTAFGSVNAQKWTQMMQDPDANFYDIVKEFDSYWKDRPYERGKGYKAFKRWQWFVEPRVYPSGNMKFASRGYALEKYNEWLQENNANKSSSSAVTSATTANWTPLGPFGSPIGGDAGRVQVIKMHPTDPNTFYVGTAAGGLWETTNGGTSYTTTTDQIASLGVADIAIDPTTPARMYIATGDKDAGDTHSTGVMKSMDGGQTWNNTGLLWTTSQQRRIYRLLINPLNPNSLIAATNVGIYKSFDAGNTWQMTYGGTFVDAEYKPNDTTTVYIVSNGAFYRSTNGGLNFSAVSIASGLNSNRLSMAVTPANNNYIYILVSATNNGFGGLYRSTNGGNSFSLMSNSPNIFDWSTNGSGTGGQGWYDIAIDASPTNANEIIAGGVNTWKSINGGANWTLNTHWYGGGGRPYVHADLHYVLYASGTTIYLGTDGGVARSTNGGSGWTTINGNMNIAQIYKMGLSASSPGRVVTGHQDNGTNLSNGSSWAEIYGGDGMDCFIDWNNNNTIIASYVNGDFQRSFNGGGSWTTITNGLNGNAAWVAPIVQSPTDPNTYFCGYTQVYKSTNQGSTWIQMGNTGALMDEIKIAPSNTNIIFATSGGSVFKTTNGGTTWSNVTAGLPTGSGSITDLAIDNQNPNNIYVTFSGYSANKVYASNNGGASWSNYSTGLPSIPVNCIVYQNNSAQALYVGTDVGIYYREASLSSWVPYFTGLPNVIVNDMEIYYPTGKIRAATYGRGVYESDIYTNPTAPPFAAFNTQFSPGCINTALQFNDLSANTPTAWVWSFPGGNPSTSTVQTPQVTYTATGVYSVTLTSSNVNGSSAPYTTTVSVVNAPTVSPVSASVCAGLPGNIAANTNGSIVNWSTGQQGTQISVSSPTTAVYTFTSSLGACSTVGTATLFVDTPPQTPTVIVMSGYLTTTVTASTYQWYLNGSPLTGETSATVVPVQDGYYSVWAFNGNCAKSSDPVQITSVGIQELGMLNGAAVGPNPAKDHIIVTFSNVIKDEVDYEIINTLGQQVSKGRLKSSSEQTSKISVQSLSQGVYYLNLKKGEASASYKFLKQ